MAKMVRSAIGAVLSIRWIPRLVAEFLNAPENFDPASSPALFRPHFVLFLAFLGLFKEAQARLNALTGRHLDFYYRQVLRIVEKGPISDRLNLVSILPRTQARSWSGRKPAQCRPGQPRQRQGLPDRAQPGGQPSPDSAR